VASLPAGAGEIIVREPDGEVRRLPPDSAARGLALQEVGFYDTETEGGGAGVTLAVNPPAAESDLVRADPAEVVAALRVADDSSAALDPVVLTVSQQEARQSWWAWLIVGALLLLAGEALYAGRLSGRPSMTGGTT
jgi:hypothetical protein